jgi:hypothetical protein
VLHSLFADLLVVVHSSTRRVRSHRLGGLANAAGGIE